MSAKLCKFLLLCGLVGAWPSAVARATPADDAYKAATQRYNDAQWKEASGAFAAFLNDFPQDPRAPQAHVYAGEALIQAGDYAEARRQFAEFLKQYPEHRHARLALFRDGEAAYLSGLEEEARGLLERFRKLHPQDEFNAYAGPYLAELDLRQSRAAEAYQGFSAALDRYPHGPLAAECRLGVGRALEKQGKFAEARRVYGQIAADPRGALADQAQIHLGLAETAAGDFAAAVQTFSGFPQQFPSSPLRPRAQLGQGWALYKLGKPAEAEREFAALEQDATLRVEATYGAGLSQKALSQWAQAAATLTAAAQLDPHHALAPAMLFHAGDAWLAAGQPADAEKAFDQVLAQSPDSAWTDDAMLGKARLAAQRHDTRLATQLAQQLLTRFPNSPLKPEVELMLAHALAEAQQYEAAVEAYRKIIGESPNTEQAAECRVEIVICLLHAGQFPAAREACDQWRDSYGGKALPAAMAYRLAEAAYAAGDRQTAAALFTDLAQEGNPPEFICKALSGLGWTQFRAGDTTASAATFQQLLTRFPDDALAAEAALVRGHALEKLGQADPALAMYRLVSEKFPASAEAPQALFRSACLHDKLQQDAEAEQLFRKLATEHPQFAELDAALCRWAGVLADANRPDEADQLYQRVRHDYPQSRFVPEATYRLAEHTLARKKYDAAETLLVELESMRADASLAPHVLYLHGRVLIGREQWETAQAPLAKLAEQFPASPLVFPAKYWLAEATYRQGNFEAAAAQFADLAPQCAGREEKWLAMIPLRRAQAVAQLKRWPEALRLAQQIEQEYPNFEQQHEVDYLIGRALASQAEFSAAREAYARVIRSARGGKTETAAMAQWMIGESYFHQENYDAALREYLRVEILYEFPRWQAGALLQAGKCHELLGQWTPAVEIYARLLKTYPSSEFNEEATRRLTAAQQQARQPRRS